MRFGCVQYARNNIRDELHQPLVLIVCEVALQDVDMQSVGLWNRYLSFLSQEDGWGGDYESNVAVLFASTPSFSPCLVASGAGFLCDGSRFVCGEGLLSPPPVRIVP